MYGVHLRVMEHIIQQFIGYIAVERGLAKATVSAYSSDLNHYVAWLQSQGITDLHNVTSNDIEAYVRQLHSEGMSVNSQSRSIASIHALHRFAFDNGFVNSDVSEHIKAQQNSHYLPDVLTIEQVEQLLDATGVKNPRDYEKEGKPLPEVGDLISAVQVRDRALLEVLYASGARVSEIVGLGSQDIDLAHGAARVIGKGTKQRLVPLGSFACAALQWYLDVSRPLLLLRNKSGVSVSKIFLNTRGKALSRQSVWEVVSRCGKLAKLPVEMHPHTLRHSFATHLIQGGADVRTVQELLGHASVTTTQIYTHIAPEQLIEVYRSSHPRAR